MRFPSPVPRLVWITLLAVIAAPAVTAAGERTPAYAVLGARVMIDGEPTPGSLVLRDGRIAVVQSGEISGPADAIVLDGTGWTLYPGFIDAHTEVGMPDLDVPRGSFTEVARALAERRAKAEPSPGLRPDVQATAVFTARKSEMETLRRAGVTVAVTAPRTLVFGGTSAVLATRDDELEHTLLRDKWAQHVAFERLRGEYPSTLMGVLAAIRQWFWNARWQADAWRLYQQAPERVERPPLDERLTALAAAAGRQPVVFSAWTENEILRALRLADELGLQAIISGGTEAWKVAADLVEARVPVLVSLDLRPRTEPKGFGGGRSGPEDDPSAAEKADAVANAARLDQAGVEFSFITRGLDDPAQWLDSLRQVVDAGLPKPVALDALTRRPAALLGLDDGLGSLTEGYAANVVAVNGDLFDDGATVAAVWIDGELYEIEAKAPQANGNRPPGDDGRSAKVGHRQSGKSSRQSSDAETAAGIEVRLDPDELAPHGPLWPEEPTTAIRHGTVLTAALEGPQRIDDGTVLVRDGRIEAVGPDAEVEIPPGARIVDAAGKFIIPGIVDAHSHMAITGGGNESSESVTPEVRIDEVIDHTDVGLFRALAGGVTTINVLHGSANVIGGQNAVLKLRWGKPAAELFFEGAPRGIKFALGENPKRSRYPPLPGVRQRYPGSRLGVELQLRRFFTAAREYQAAWDAYEALQQRGGEEAMIALPPRRDLRLETLVDVLQGKILVHAHCYRADEILMLLSVADDFGFHITSLQHVLEGYKVADEIAAHGTGASTFADNWGYKVEAFDAIPYNMALMTERGVRVSINSDSDERVRRLYQEAAKAIEYGGVSQEEALRMITLHPAWQLGIDERVGSLEPGKDADIAVFSAHPFTAEASVDLTFVDGQVYFDRSRVEGVREAIVELAEAEAKALGEEEKPRRERRKGDREEAAEPEPRPIAERYASWTPPPTPETAPPAVTLPSDYGDAESTALPRRGETVALVGGTVYTMSGSPIEGGTVLASGGRIVAVGRDLEIPDSARRVDTTGMRVQPGLIDTGTALGLTEIAAVAATQDLGEIEEINSSVKASVAIHPDSELIPVTRVNGVTSVLTLPRGGIVGGQAAFLDLDGWTPMEMVARSPVAMQITFPEKRPSRFGEDDAEDREERIEEQRQTLEDWMRRARAYAGALATGRVDPADQEVDLELQALVPVVRGELPVILEVETAEGIDAALELVARLELRAILAGSRDYWRRIDAIAAAGVPVLLGPIERSPEEDAPYDAIFTTAALLHEKSVPFAFRTADSANARNLPDHAALAVAWGLGREAARSAMTVEAARILGVDDLVGTLEPGKVANVVVTDGDLLDVPSRVVHLFIRGREIPLESRHTRLWETYRHRPSPPSAPVRAVTSKPSPGP